MANSELETVLKRDVYPTLSSLGFKRAGYKWTFVEGSLMQRVDIQRWSPEGELRFTLNLMVRNLGTNLVNQVLYQDWQGIAHRIEGEDYLHADHWWHLHQDRLLFLIFDQKLGDYSYVDDDGYLRRCVVGPFSREILKIREGWDHSFDLQLSAAEVASVSIEIEVEVVKISPGELRIYLGDPVWGEHSDVVSRLLVFLKINFPDADVFEYDTGQLAMVFPLLITSIKTKSLADRIRAFISDELANPDGYSGD